ncbi:hypothetical protein D9M71_713120 [compost metagenome]
MTVVLHDLGHLPGQQRIPVVGLGDVIEFSQQTQCAPLLDIRAFDLCGGRWIAGDRARLEHGHGSGPAATGHGVVLPHEAVFLHLRLERFDGFGFAAGGPPMQHFNRTGIGGNSAQGQQGGKGNDSGETIDRIH